MANEHCCLNNELVLRQPFGNPLPIRVTEVMATWQEDTLSDCRLRFWVSWKSYQQIELQQLFNFDTDLQSASSEAFLPELDVEITALLAPHLLSELQKGVVNPETIISYVQKLSRQNELASLLDVDNWIGLFAKQTQPQGEVSYRTFWDYLDWTTIAQNALLDSPDELLLQATTDFLKDTAFKHLISDSATYDHARQKESQLVETIFALAPNLLSQPDTAKEKLSEAIAQLFRESLETQLSEQWSIALEADDTVPLPSITEASLQGGRILQQLIRFFQQEDWSISKFEDQPVLKLRFQGKNGKWTCYAQANEAEQQVIFYSVMPRNVPRKRRSAIAEFITRANYGLILGNFEMDFSDGEIRYKTSLGVEGSALDVALIQQLVYSNLLITDQYFAGIQQVIDGVSAVVAIAQIENKKTAENVPVTIN